MSSRRRSNFLRLALLAFLIPAGTAGCGKKGPPRAPLVRVPNRVTPVTAHRLGGEVVVRFTIPTTNQDGRGPADVERVDVYAYTGSATGEESIDIVKQGTVVGSIPVRKPPEPEEPEEPEEEDTRDQREKKERPPPPPEPKPPGTYDQGETAAVTEPLTPAVMVPDKAVLAEREKTARRAAPPVFRAFRWPAPTELPRRYYAAVAVGPSGKKSGVSERASVPLFRPASPPAIADFQYTETGITILWIPPPDAPRPIIGEPVSAVPARTAAPAETAVPVVPVKPVPVLPPLPSTSIVPNRSPATYNIYDAKPDDTGVIKPLNAAPLAAPMFVDARLEFGTERCYAVRTVTTVGELSVESEPSHISCVTPADIFPPSPPRNLAAVGGDGVISLIWEPNTETDLGGYLVLRAEAPGEKLQPLTPAPIRETTFRDTTVKPGVRYVYVVQAVDSADPPNVSGPSNRVEEAARD